MRISTWEKSKPETGKENRASDSEVKRKKEQKRIQRTEENLRRKFNWIIRDSTREIKNFFFLIQVVFLLKHKYEDRMSWKRE